MRFFDLVRAAERLCSILSVAIYVTWWLTKIGWLWDAAPVPAMVGFLLLMFRTGWEPKAEEQICQELDG